MKGCSELDFVVAGVLKRVVASIACDGAVTAYAGACLCCLQEKR